MDNNKLENIVNNNRIFNNLCDDYDIAKDMIELAIASQQEIRKTYKSIVFQYFYSLIIIAFIIYIFF